VRDDDDEDLSDEEALLDADSETDMHAEEEDALDSGDEDNNLDQHVGFMIGI
jgi:hypothetical protein